jgi:hypothetical protein
VLALVVPLLLALHPPMAGAQVPPSETPEPSLPPLRPPRQPDTDLSPRLRIFVQQINVVGSTAFPPEVIARVTAPYEKRYLTQEDLQALRVELTKLYTDQGYVNSGVILPDQTIRDGQVTYQVIEGGITALNISGNRWFREAYLRAGWPLAPPSTSTTSNARSSCSSTIRGFSASGSISSPAFGRARACSTCRSRIGSPSAFSSTSTITRRPPSAPRTASSPSRTST